MVFAGGERPASAHAFLAESDPAANAVLPNQPQQMRLRFTEPLERVASTRASLYDQTGALVGGTEVSFDDADRHVMVLSLPAGLANGTYSAVWQTLSAADGHRAQGYVPFTIGSAADIRTVVPPATAQSTGPPQWLKTISRWVPYAGLALAVAVWPVWLLVLRPAISPAWQAGPALTRRVKRLAFAGIVVALLGSVLALLVQAAVADAGEGLLSATRTTLTDTRYGQMWLLRVALLLALGVALASCGWWWPRRLRWVTMGTLVLAVAAPLPFSLISHAAAQTEGRSAAIAFDLVHLLGASVWAGGLFVLAGALLPTLRDLTTAGRRVVLARAIPRFSAMALVAWAVLGITGLYSAWLQVGNLDGLRDTAYGTSLSVKLLLLVPLLLLAAFNLLVVGRRFKGAMRGEAPTVWSKRFGAVVLAEVVLVLAVLLVVGRLTSQPPARDTLTQAANQISIPLDLQGHPATLTLAPGDAGPNHYRLDVPGDPLPANAEALIRLELPALRAGENEIALTRASGNAFEYHGSELSAAGDWRLEVIVREIGSFQWSGRTALAVGQPGSAQDGLPRTAWKFGPAGIAGLLLVVAGLAGFAVAWRAGRTPLRKESAGLGTVALALGAILLLQSRVTTASAAIDFTLVNPVPNDAASLARGEAIYQANCLQCHGAAGRGDGPAAAAYVPAPADFTTAHARLHVDGEFYYWIENGKPPTAMPAFDDDLEDEEIWDVINFIHELQRRQAAERGAAATPAAGP